MKKGVEAIGVANRMKFNLQYFAEGAPEGGEPAPAPEGNGGDPASGEPGTPEKDPAKAFAARLGHERKRIESEYAPFKSVIERQAKASGMETQEYLEYLRAEQEREELEAEAEATGKTPEALKAMKEKEAAEAKVKAYERKEKMTAEEKELTSDPKVGKFVSEHLDKIREIAEGADVDLRTALAVVVAEKLPELLENANPEKHITAYIESLKKGGKPIEYGGGATSPQATAPKTFDDARKAALAMLKNGG